MSEGLRKRMSAIVGDENTVGRYLLEKIAHTALLAWVLVCFAPDLAIVRAAIIAAAAYVGTGKLIWFATHRELSLLDLAFDLLVCLAPALVALALTSRPLALVALVVWFALLAMGSNNQWGSPS